MDQIELEIDNCGRIRNCQFCITKNKQVICNALSDFYNKADRNNMCGKCPFFKLRKGETL